MRYYRSFPRILRDLKKQYPALPIFSIDGSNLTPYEVLLAIAAAIGPEVATNDPSLRRRLDEDLLMLHSERVRRDIELHPVEDPRMLYPNETIMIYGQRYVFVGIRKNEENKYVMDLREIAEKGKIEDKITTIVLGPYPFFNYGPVYRWGIKNADAELIRLAIEEFASPENAPSQEP